MRKNDFLISVVVPCYNEEKNIPLMIDELQKHLRAYRYEVILVDDGSSDDSSDLCERLYGEITEVNYIRFARNFGHQAALQAGITCANGEAVVTIDADLQQPPSVIPAMVKCWLDGHEIVEAIPEYTDSIGWFKKYTSYIFYWVLNKLSDYPVVKKANDFRLIDRKVADEVGRLKENHLYLRGFFSWVGFNKGFVHYDHKKRINGETHYPFYKMVRLALNGITSMSVRPLRLALILGSIVSLIAFAIICWALYLAVFTERTIAGWTSTIVSTLFLAGIQLLVLGIMGEYLGKLFIENKQRPNYIIRDKCIRNTVKDIEHSTSKTTLIEQGV
ncbi:glycosyltransferase [Puteibacter caeruleilacunae]|nr:glycosyltransferase [Puteibacter caeruleilacunae]